MLRQFGFVRNAGAEIVQEMPVAEILTDPKAPSRTDALCLVNRDIPSLLVLRDPSPEIWSALIPLLRLIPRSEIRPRHRIATCRLAPPGMPIMLSLENMRAFLEEAAKRRRVVTYRDIASALEVWPPNTIHQVTGTFELLMEEDAATRRPFITALAVSGRLGDLPRRGFLDCAGRLGRFDGDPDGQDART
jgi:hypothetical protein